MNVREAAKMLDEIRPEWYNVIIEENLDMADVFKCVLGQVFGHFNKGILILFHTIYTDRYLVSEPFGFMTNVQLWKDEINERKMSRHSLSASA